MGSTVPIQEALTQSIVSVLIDGVMAILMLIILYLYSPVLGTIVLISVAHARRLLGLPSIFHR